MSEKKIPNLKLAKELSKIYSDVDGLSLQNLFYTYNEYFPNCYMFSRSSREGDYYFDTVELLKCLQELAKTDYKDEHMETIEYCTEDLTTKEVKKGICVLFKESNIFARIENSISESYILYANDGYGALNKFKEILYRFYIAPEEEKNHIFKIYQDNTGFHLNKGNIKEVAIDINLHYNDDFPAQDAKIRRFIEQDDKSGLVILHGEKGTGKTTYIKNLITSYPNRKFVFLSPDLISVLGTPTFTTFLNGLQNHVIILEDCENAIRDRKNNFGSSASAVSVLLNMTDGILADDLGMKFICTFNEDIKDIDSALMRKGRLVSKYEFKKLTVEKTNALLKELYKDVEGDVPTSKVPMTLADIFYMEEESYEEHRKSII